MSSNSQSRLGQIICWVIVVVLAGILLLSIVDGEVAHGKFYNKVRYKRVVEPIKYWLVVSLHSVLLGAFIYCLIKKDPLASDVQQLDEQNTGKRVWSAGRYDRSSARQSRDDT